MTDPKLVGLALEGFDPDPFKQLSINECGRVIQDRVALFELVKEELARVHGERRSIKDYSEEEIQDALSRVCDELEL